MKYPELYKNICEIHPIPEEEFEFSESMLLFRTIPKNTVIVKPGDIDHKFFLIVSGMVRMFYTNDKGQEFTKTFLKESDIAAAYAEMLQGIPSRVYIETIFESTMLEFSWESFEKLKERHECWREFARKIAEKYFIFREQREHDLLMLSLKERYEKLAENYPELIESIPQYQIASYLSATPVSLSRALKKK
jgi:CRP-like cAMP-binding protein